jgi:holliday junction DNA helicase RuvA
VIGRLSGVVAEVEAEECLVDVVGVGYVVRCGARTLQRLPAGEAVVLHIDSQTREDGTRLYGFLSKDERAAFLALQAIQGVGPKAALAVLDVLPPTELAQAVAREDKTAVARASGVGVKLALRIVTELKGKPLGAGLAMPPNIGLAPSVGPAPPTPSVSGEAVAALIGLGVAEPLGRRAVETANARLGADIELPAVIKAALQELGR